VRASRNEGVVSNDDVARAYRNEETVAPDSTTKAYLAPRAQGKSWRGARLPIRLRNRVGRSPLQLSSPKKREGVALRKAVVVGFDGARDVQS
jgi:hypothetical protein